MSETKFNKSKIAIIGAGAVGSTAAYVATLKNLAAQIILIDVNETKEAGEVMDIADGLCFVDTGCVKGANFKDAADADVIVITAGLAQKPGETRLDLVKKNATILKSILKQIGKIKSTSIILMIANPVDILTYLAQEWSGLPKNQVFGSGTTLDTARLKTELSHLLKISSHNIHGFVMGEHGDSEFVAWSTVNVGGVAIEKTKLLDKKQYPQIAERVKKEAYEIINRKGATFYGIAMVISEIIEAILYDQHKILPISARLKNWQGISDVCLGAPTVIGRCGVIKHWPINLNANEKKKLQKSANTLKGFLKSIL
ncbi:MAG: L-lactate dehydrogenase [Candidatus Magasanikbacteria bacterium GW2011_GWC2_37_14]|uniref:L-lactate dehydrogenase n=1 Tax=Candidatus Magasanikbacteria bacterium GW2011_GWC2_37_14 TaxID=1619046 RepID=A0A0G0G7G4_9BACT|nr:MAG: L-lactate dehydrogenase [Candidatus Magasanikbacteria bacterium GW2011_GWC2_37_14]